MKFASVILDIPTQALDTPYTYLVPDASQDPIESGMPGSQGVCDPIGAARRASELPVEIGCAVLVPFGGRRAVGFVIDLWEGDAPEGIDPCKIKPIVGCLSKPYFNETGAKCAQWLSREYIAPLSACIRLFTPPNAVPRMVRASKGYWRVEQPSVGEVDDRWVVRGPQFGNYTPRKNAVKQIALMHALESGGELRVAELNAQLGSVSSVVSALQKKGVVVLEHRRRMRGIEMSLDDVQKVAELNHMSPSTKPELTSGQARALKLINQCADAGHGQVVLVDGVTGSGKTEVYLRAIEHVLAQGKTACVLVPEISLTPQTVGRFRARFGNTVAVIHSRMSPGERFDQWDFIHSGSARVVVGARSALFTPLKNVGMVVIDEEHEGSYKQDQAPRYNTRDVAAWLAHNTGATLVLGSATPSIESLYSCKHNSGWHYVSLPERANGRPLPEIQVVDMAAEFSGGARSMFSSQLTEGLLAELSAGHKVVLLLNQRGFAKFLLCRDCGYVPKCPHCDTSLTFHEYGNHLICHHCGYQQQAPRLCPECGSPYLKKFGAGTQRVEAQLRALLNGMPGVGAEVPIIRMDADTTSTKGAHQRLLEQFASSDAAVLLGTQMIAKGLDFDDVTLVGVVNADTQLQLPDFRSHERTFDLIEQVAGRAGRAELDGRVLVQTYEADSVPIRAAASYNRNLFLDDELTKRKMLGYPPFARFVRVLVWGASEQQVKELAAQLQAALEKLICGEGLEGWQVNSALPCVLAKLRNAYRYHVLIKAPAAADTSEVLLPFFRSYKPHKDVNIAVDVDPEDLL